MEINGRECIIYSIVNIITSERYVGSTINFKNRKRSHWSDLRLHKHGSWKLQRAYNWYGETNFRFIILESFYPEFLVDLYAREQYWIDLYHPEYNINKIAGSFIPLSARSKKAKKQANDKKRGRKQSQEEKDKRAASIRKFWATHPPKTIPETMRRHLSKINMGKKNPNYGLKRSDETRQKISNAVGKKIRDGFISPDGVQYLKVQNLMRFCREHDLDYWSMTALDKRKRKSYNGWQRIDA